MYYCARIGGLYATGALMSGGVLLLWYAIGETLHRSWGALPAVPIAIACSFIAGDIWTRALSPRVRALRQEYAYLRRWDRDLPRTLELIDDECPDTQRSGS